LMSGHLMSGHLMFLFQRGQNWSTHIYIPAQFSNFFWINVCSYKNLRLSRLRRAGARKTKSPGCASSSGALDLRLVFGWRWRWRWTWRCPWGAMRRFAGQPQYRKNFPLCKFSLTTGHPMPYICPVGVFKCTRPPRFWYANLGFATNLEHQSHPLISLSPCPDGVEK
jgi:hypothetical protein